MNESATHRALQGRRILVTRAAHQSSDLVRGLAELGADPLVVPLIELLPPESWEPLNAALTDWGHYDAVVFTSANAARAFFAHTKAALNARPLLPPPLVCAIGPATAAAVQTAGWDVGLMPESFVAEDLAATLARRLRPGQRVLLPRAARARDVLPQHLAARGIQVDVAPVYRTAIPAEARAQMERVFAPSATALYAVIFTSASTVEHFVELLQSLFGSAWRARLQRVHTAAIGPITREAILAHGLAVAVEASAATLPALISALQDFAGRDPSSAPV